VRAILHHEADEEFHSAIKRYLAESQELGIRFYREVLATLARIESHPRVWPRLRGGVRKCFVNDSPCKLLYAIQSERIFVVAVMHARRKPGYWAERL